MLAHDVKKPFTMMESVIQALQSVSGISQMKKVINDSSPEIKKAIRNIDGMLGDILEIDSKSEIQKDRTSLEAMIESFVVDIFRYSRDCEIRIEYRLEHTKDILIDQIKMGRVFANIIGNAVQAMPKDGMLWFASSDKLNADGPYVKIEIGNTGSYICDEDRK